LCACCVLVDVDEKLILGTLRDKHGGCPRKKIQSDKFGEP